MKTEKTIELKILKIILWVYIILCFVIAGLNYGYASKAQPETAALIAWFWHFYENVIKTLFIIICSFLTLRIVGTSEISSMRKRNLIGFVITALVVHIVAPLILHNKELYFFTMPPPWSTTAMQLLHAESSFYLSRVPVWGVAGITTALIFYIGFSIVVVIGTLLFGRRWQCSTLCLFNGFASEVFAPAFPLAGEPKKASPKLQKLFSCLRWIFLSLASFFTLYWILFLLGMPLGKNLELISKLEEYVYLCGELLIAMFFWVAFIGRGYCYYCPLGTVLGFMGKIAGQRIDTNHSKCIQCSQCNNACAMSIDISSKALVGAAMKDLSCVGCGHCVDACPTKTLAYSTKFLDMITDKSKIDSKITYAGENKELNH